MRASLVLLLSTVSTATVSAAEVSVADASGLRQALETATAGTTILIAPGTYQGGITICGLRGERDRPIVLRAADPSDRPVFEGRSYGFHLSDVANVELQDLIVAGASDNGINIDDGGSTDTPSRHVVLRGITVRDIGPEGNRDGIKLSGVEDFQVEKCVIERWGDGGSGVDLVGCRRGRIIDCLFRHDEPKGANGVQTKGGSSDILIQRCRFENAGQRAVNLGGSTGLAFFRPRDARYEAKNVTVEDCTFLGSTAPVAFVGVDGATVRHNTIYRPKRWTFRILQENRQPDFVACRNGVFSDKIVAFRADEMTVPVNVGPDTAPETFALSRNVWYCLDAPQRSRVRLAVPEAEGTYGIDPQFENAEDGDLRLRQGSPAGAAGVRNRTEGQATD